MKDLPKRVREEFTQACILCDSATSSNDIDVIVAVGDNLKANGYSFPEWLNLMLDWKRKDLYLSTEEYFKKNYAFFPEYEYQKMRHIIDDFYFQNREAGYRQALFAIGFQILIGSGYHDDGLNFEWYLKATEFQSLDTNSNRDTFIKMLKRESDFWLENDTGINVFTQKQFQSKPSFSIQN